MKRHAKGSPFLVSWTPRSFLAALVAFACVISLGTDLTLLAASPDKKAKRSPVLKGLPITDLSEDEARFSMPLTGSLTARGRATSSAFA